MVSAAAEIATYGGFTEIEGGPKNVKGWETLLPLLLEALKALCPKKFANEESFKAAFTSEHRKLRRSGQSGCCPLLLRPTLKRNGIKGKAAQDETFFRLVMGASGYTLAELEEGA